METTFYSVPARIEREVCIAVVADLHERPFEEIKKAFSLKKPDVIAIPGDVLDGYGKRLADSAAAMSFLKYCAGTAPTVFSLGNHERGFDDRDAESVKNAGVILLENSDAFLCGIHFGGLTSKAVSRHTGTDGYAFIDRFAQNSDYYRVLLCHHPEYYPGNIRHTKIELVLSGHAHGGQIRLFGRGLFASGQGFFPKYTSGLHEGRLVISRGLSNTGAGGLVPRLFNPTELVFVRLIPQN